MKACVSERSLQAYYSTPVAELSRREQEIMVLFGSTDVVMSRKQIWRTLCEALGDRAPGEGGVCGRIDSLMTKGQLVHRGEWKDPKTGKPQELVGLPVNGQGSLFA
ncbi:MAG TPA: hypothetical protein VJ654_14180 [Noviherbaspirillum sp.]|nr:hypothetical protein [Noviherbaspirillum sp.]